MWYGAASLLFSLFVNSVSKNYIFFRPGPRIAYGYLGGWPNLILPIAAFYLALTGLLLFAFGPRHRPDARNALRYHLLASLCISLVVTALYAAFYFSVQFVVSGADKSGECPGLIEAADRSHDIPPSAIPVGPPGPAVGCGTERYGILLSRYYDLSVYGVTGHAEQDRVLANLSSYRSTTSTDPIHVAFYEKQNWNSWRNDKNGASGGGVGPENLIRVATPR